MNLLKSSATVGGMTMISRVLGFVRDILIANYLGTGPIADAWVVAFRFPNLFRRFFAEGAFNSAFVPLYTKRLEGGRANSREVIRRRSAGCPWVRSARLHTSADDLHALGDDHARARVSLRP